MERLIIAIAFILLFNACKDQQETKEESTTKTFSIDTPGANSPTIKAVSAPQPTTVAADTTANNEEQIYSNKRFRNVRVQKLANDSFLITGQGQIFEASFNWVIEDGHQELQHSYASTDAGAPEWGNFSFKIHAPKKATNSTLHLVLFETSMKDGSRQYELPLLLH